MFVKYPTKSLVLEIVCYAQSGLATRSRTTYSSMSTTYLCKYEILTHVIEDTLISYSQ